MIVDDAWTFTDPAGGEADTTVRYMVAGEVRMPEPGRAVVQPLAGARSVTLTWDHDLATGRLTERGLDDPMLAEVWGERLTRLDLHVRDDVHGRLTLTLEVSHDVG